MRCVSYGPLTKCLFQGFIIWIFKSKSANMSIVQGVKASKWRFRMGGLCVELLKKINTYMDLIKLTSLAQESLQKACRMPYLLKQWTWRKQWWWICSKDKLCSENRCWQKKNLNRFGINNFFRKFKHQNVTIFYICI